ncbi:glycosyltransferase family 2 protein [Candidatus Woesearchaeota archaeon]|nr:glycosyltransferase family 2 protein [Candidatus Woesearchaeota archaeon]
MISKISIIIPVYNEEGRMSSFFKDLNEYCVKNLKKYEIIAVNDGSKDRSLDILKDMKYKNLRIISYTPNKGKANAVRTGVSAATGSHLLFIDADGATAPKEISKMLSLFNKYDVVVGSRNLKESKVEKDFTRRILSFGFNNYVSILFQTSFSDYLCGFKGFRTDIARKLFSNLKSERWIFDVELFHRIKKHKVSYKEVAIKWTHQNDSNMKTIDVVKIFFQLLFLRFRI